MLNADKIWLGDPKSQRSPTSVARDMYSQMLIMVDKYGSISSTGPKKGLHFSNLITTPEYRRYIYTTWELQTVSTLP
jgi:hypothetical protein